MEIPHDFKEVTGFDTPVELAAYEKGREDEQAAVIKFIKNWSGKTNSHVGKLLYSKFIELKLQPDPTNDFAVQP
jgi:hypothetical protein